MAPGSELLLKATDARNTASHIEPRTTRSHNHTQLSHTPQLSYPGLNLADRGELITKPKLIKPLTAHAFLQGEPGCLRMGVRALTISRLVKLCIFVSLGFVSIEKC